MEEALSVFLEFSKVIGGILGKASKELLAMIIAVFILMTYWIVCIYFISPSFYNTHNLFIISIISFVFSINWFISNIVFVVVQKGSKDTKDIIKNAQQKEEHKPDSYTIMDFLLISLFNSLMILILFSFVFFLIRSSYTQLRFLHLILCLYGYIFLIFFFQFGLYIKRLRDIQKIEVLKEIDYKIANDL